MAGVIGRLVKWLVILAVIAAVALLGTAYYLGAWNILFPSTAHESEPPALPAGLVSPAVLVFSKTNQFRHRDGIAGGNRALADIAASRDWSLVSTENGAVFNERDLARFSAVVFLNTTGDVLDARQEQAFQHWLEAGGGWLGIHAAGDGSHADWPWYMEHLLGAEFTAHILDPQFQTATVITENPGHPANAGMPAVWNHEEEWYSWRSSPRERGFTVLATVDEASYNPVQKMLGKETDLSMGDHPVVWANCVGDGRALYSAMGHTAAAFDEPAYRRLLANALAWTIGATEGGCGAGR